MTIQEVINKVLAYHPKFMRYAGCDEFKCGCPEDECTGIVTAMDATVNVVKKAAELLAKREIDLMLCGHIHRPYRKVDATGRGECCAGSVTLNGTMTEIDYDPETRNFTYNAVKI